MKKILGIALILAFTQNAYAVTLIGGEESIDSQKNYTHEDMVKKCVADKGSVEKGTKYVNNEALTTYTCRLKDDSVCGLETYYLGQCAGQKNYGSVEEYKQISELKKKNELVDNKDNGQKESKLITDYRKILEARKEMAFLKDSGWTKSKQVKANLSKALILLDGVDTGINKMIKKKPKFKDALLGLKNGNEKVRDEIMSVYIKNEVATLSPTPSIMNGVWKVTSLEKIDKLKYLIEAEEGTIDAIYVLNFIPEKENGLYVLNIEKTLL